MNRSRVDEFSWVTIRDWEGDFCALMCWYARLLLFMFFQLSLVFCVLINLAYAGVQIIRFVIVFKCLALETYAQS